MVTGAAITAPDVDPFAPNAMSLTGPTSVLNVSGGTIAGGSGSYAGGSGLVADGGQISISGGNFIGGDSSGFFAYRYGGFGADIYSFTSLHVSGGNFSGGIGWPGGDGMRIGLYGASNTAYISGGNFYPGNSPYGYVFGNGLSIYNTQHAVITGGGFYGGWNPTNRSGFGLHAANSSVDANGGYAGATLLEAGAVLHVNGAAIGPLAMFDNAIATIKSGYVDWPDFHDSAVVNMKGGYMTGGGFIADNAVVNVRGGHFGRLDSPSDLTQNAVLNVYGMGLSFENDLLQGTLQDGTPVEAWLRVYDSATIHLFEVPEPSGFVLALAGLLGLAWFRRRNLTPPGRSGT
ncbi:MAG: hypothetical protein K1X74_01895 [Pirellulales bacterium]|nr:hypothetical protein [Pirellulales bacterium]